jgi:hypothetical protein
MLKLSPRESNTPYIATYYAVTGLCLAVSTIVGGVMQDAWGGRTVELLFGGVRLDYYGAIFLFGWLSRTAGVLLLLMVKEPQVPSQTTAWPVRSTVLRKPAAADRR